MSLESIDVDGLERKDRAELATIAQALGGKPTSRAKKADIIAMILDLAGVTDGASGAAASGAAASGAAASGDEAAAATPDAAEATDQDQRPSSGGDAPGGDDSPPSRARGRQSGRGGRGPARSGEAADDGAPDAGPSNSDHGSRSTRAGTSDDADQAKQSGRSRSDAQDQGDTSQGDQSDDQGNAADQGNAGQGNQSDGQGESESGRRRRRRRGRDRDRNEDDNNNAQWEGNPIEVSGILDLRDEGYGFLRVNGLLPSRDDVYVSVKQTRQFGLRRGDVLSGASRPASRGEKNPALLRIDKVNGVDPDDSRDRPHFESLTPVFPNEKLHLEREDHPYDVTARLIDLLAPIGKGQRGLIVSPPKAGKTTIVKTIAQAIEANHPDVELMVLLVDERPEEVTDMLRSISGEVVSSTFDRPAEEHTQVAELAIERAKRMVELGHDVVVILDGITRLARAYNLAAPSGGRIMSGGLDTAALYPPKRFLGAARNVEEGGSLTILATALVETNSKMDEVIFEEFKGTGNMELRLDRRVAEQRVFPAIDIDGSSTRHEELLSDSAQLQQIWKLRRLLSALSNDGEVTAAVELVSDRMRKFPTNEAFLAEIAKGPAVRG